MRKFTPILFGAVTAATLAMAGAATAQPGPGPRAGMERPAQPTTRAEAEQRATQAFARMDANGDGFLNSKDREARAAQRFARLDTDGNGQLSQEEFNAPRDKMRGTMKGRRGTGEPGQGFARKGMGGKHGWRGHGRGGMMGQMADADKDGQISAEEFQAAALARFDSVDTDGNGTISDAERQAMRDAMKAKRDAFREQRAARRNAQ